MAAFGAGGNKDEASQYAVQRQRVTAALVADRTQADTTAVGLLGAMTLVMGAVPYFLVLLHKT